MASPTQWQWVQASSGSRCWTGKPGMLQSMGSQRLRHDWATELNCTFPIWNQFTVPCLVLTVASWPACRFLRRHVRWSVTLISCTVLPFLVIHTVKGFGIVNKVEVDVFLKFAWFFYDPTDVGNLISGSSGFSKSSLNIWNFTVHVLLKPSLENFEHYFASVWDECNCVVVWWCRG